MDTSTLSQLESTSSALALFAAIVLTMMLFLILAVAKSYLQGYAVRLRHEREAVAKLEYEKQMLAKKNEERRISMNRALCSGSYASQSF